MIEREQQTMTRSEIRTATIKQTRDWRNGNMTIKQTRLSVAKWNNLVTDRIQ